MKQINALKARPEFYNTLTTNCTTNIWYNSLVNAEHLPLQLEDPGQRLRAGVPL